MSKNTRSFELKMGKSGLVLFLLGMGLFLFISFLLGVVVGRHLDTYPEKIASLPGRLVEGLGFLRKPPAATGRLEVEITPEPILPAASGEKTGDEGQARRQETVIPEELPKEGEEGAEKSIAQDSKVKESSLNGNARPPGPPAKYLIQLVSFRDRGKAEEVCEKIIKLGFEPQIELLNHPTSGLWHRVIIKGYVTRREAEEAIDMLSRHLQGVKGVIRSNGTKNN